MGKMVQKQRATILRIEYSYDQILITELICFVNVLLVDFFYKCICFL